MINTITANHATQQTSTHTLPIPLETGVIPGGGIIPIGSLGPPKDEAAGGGIIMPLPLLLLPFTAG
eukprot:scaffold1192_cov206-Alexandrium_tamarense.AAC.18